MDFIQGFNRNQLQMMSFDEFVSSDSWARNPEYYRQRQQITEHQFDTLKRQWGFTFTLRKGKENVLSEVNLMMTVYNLRRLISIFSVNDLKTKLKELVFCFLRIFKGNNKVLRSF